ncbi:MAG: class I SAM-dependent methyltransferase [Gallionella sp.]|jgi:SAM-dependent methyltransferase
MRIQKSGTGVSNDLHKLVRMQMRSSIPQLKYKWLLDIGTDDARFCKLMMQDGVIPVGIDIDRCSKPSVIANAMHLPFNRNTFDIVTMISVSDLLEKWELNTALQEINRVLKNGGYFVHGAGEPMIGHPKHWERVLGYGVSIFSIAKEQK